MLYPDKQYLWVPNNATIIKGGIGKSIFTTLVASTMHYRLGYNIVVFDADFPQHSLIKMKERDLKMTMENETLKKLAYKQFTMINKKAYPILQHKADNVLSAAYDFTTILQPQASIHR